MYYRVVQAKGQKNPNDRYVAVSSHACVVICDVKSGRRLIRFPSSQDDREDILDKSGSLLGLASFVSGGCPFVAAGGRNGVHIFSLRTKKFVYSLQHSSHFPVYRLLHVPEWGDEVFVSSYSTVCRYEMGQGKVLETSWPRNGVIGDSWGHEGDVRGLAASVTRGLLFSAGNDAAVCMWPRNGRRRIADPLSVDRVESLVLSAGGKCCYFADDKDLLLVGCRTGMVEAWDIRQTNERLLQFHATLTGPSNIFDMDRLDEETFVTSSVKKVTSWTISGKVRCQARLPGAGLGVCAIDFGSDGVAGSSGMKDAEEGLLEERLAFLLSEFSRMMKVSISLVGSEDVLLAPAWFFLHE